MIFHVLGSGCSELNPQRSSPAYLVGAGEQWLMLDLGQGAWRRLMEAGFAPALVSAVLLSHHHLDHMADLLPLLFALNYDAGLKAQARMTLVAHAGFARVWEGLGQLFGDWVRPAPENLATRWLEPGDRTTLGALELACAASAHIQTSLAYRLTWGEQSLVYLGDSALCPGLDQLARGADLLVCHTVGDPEHPNPKHMHPAQAGALARVAGVGGLVLSHLYADQDPGLAVASAAGEFGGPVWAARDHLELAWEGRERPRVVKPS